MSFYDFLNLTEIGKFEQRIRQEEKERIKQIIEGMNSNHGDECDCKWGWDGHEALFALLKKI